MLYHIAGNTGKIDGWPDQYGSCEGKVQNLIPHQIAPAIQYQEYISRCTLDSTKCTRDAWYVLS